MGLLEDVTYLLAGPLKHPLKANSAEAKRKLVNLMGVGTGIALS
ncbi:hypothetical protein [Pseudovibrio axinellae]|nr:hypothetical protein [Pseudovibrio axinellae]